MAGSDDRFASDLGALIRDAQAGSGDSARAVVQRLSPPLSAVIRHRLGRPLCRLYDADDFLIETFQEVFSGHFREGVLTRPVVLWAYLRRIVEHKIRDAERRYESAGRNLGRDQRLEQLASQPAAGQQLSAVGWTLLEQVMAQRLEDYIAEQPRVHRVIIRLMLGGIGTAEIAVEVRLTPRHVRRIAERCYQAMACGN